MADRIDKTGAGRYRPGPKRGIVWILAGIVVVGLIAGYDWLRRLPK